MLNEKETTILSSILTATTGVAKTLVAIREEQKQQSKQIKNLENVVNTQVDEMHTTIKETTKTVTQLLQGLTDMERQFKTEQETIKTAILTEQNEQWNQVRDDLRDKFVGLVDILAENNPEDVEKKVTAEMQQIQKVIEKNHEQTTATLEQLNQVKALKVLIEALTVMQTDMTTLTENITHNSTEFHNLMDASRTMAARLGSVDLRLASFVKAETDNQDDGESDEELQTLQNVVKLLDSQLEEA